VQNKEKLLGNNEKKPKGKRPASNAYMKYSGMAMQMAAILLLGVYAGKKMDEYFQTEPYLLVVMALFSIFAALYSTLKDLL